MENGDYKQLEVLLGKLQLHLGRKFCIIPNYIHGGIHMATYDETGKIADQIISATIKDGADALLKELDK